MAGSPVFPLFELYVAAAILALIAGGLYWLGGAWGIVLLWGMGVLFLLPLASAPIGLFLLGMAKISEHRWAAAAARLAGSLLLGLVWLAAVGYCAYRAYLAIP